MKKSFVATLALSLLAGAAVAEVPAGVRTPLLPWTGIKVMAKLDDANAREVYSLNYIQLYVNYSGSVDFQIRSEGVLLTAENAGLLYSPGAVPECRYVPGSRPELEKIVGELTENLTSPQEKALAIMRFCRDLYKKKPYPVEWDKYVFGGTEEELIEKGEILCEALARLEVALCEIAGIPGRVVMHVTGGHVVCEVYTEHGWGYIDPRFGIYYLDEKGHLASIQTLIERRELLRKQTPEVERDTVAYQKREELVDLAETCFFNAPELNVFEYYSLADAAKYSYQQTPQAIAYEHGLREVNKRYGAALTSRQDFFKEKK